MHLLPVCFISYIKKQGKWIFCVFPPPTTTNRRAEVVGLVTGWEPLPRLYAQQSASTDTWPFQRSLCFSVQTRWRTHKPTKFQRRKVPQCISLLVPRCQLRACVLSESCLETTRRLLERTNTHRLPGPEVLKAQHNLERAEKNPGMCVHSLPFMPKMVVSGFIATHK